jgi:hypothetical protein
MPTRVANLALRMFCFTSRAAWTRSPIAGDWQGSMKVDGTKENVRLGNHNGECSEKIY